MKLSIILLFSSVLLLSCSDSDLAKDEAQKYCVCIEPMVEMRKNLERETGEKPNLDKKVSTEQLMIAQEVAKCLQDEEGKKFEEFRKTLSNEERIDYMARFRGYVRKTCPEFAESMGIK